MEERNIDYRIKTEGLLKVTVSKVGLHCRSVNITHSHGRLLRECCKGNDQSQRRRASFDPRHP